MEFDVGKRLAAIGLGGIAAGKIQHLGRHVDADGFSGRPDSFRRQEHVQSATATEVHDGFARFQAGKSGGVAAREAHIRFGGDRRQLFRRIAECLGHGLDSRMLGRKAALGDRCVLGLNCLCDGIGHGFFLSNGFRLTDIFA